MKLSRGAVALCISLAALATASDGGAAPEPKPAAEPVQPRAPAAAPGARATPAPAAAARKTASGPSAAQSGAPSASSPTPRAGNASAPRSAPGSLSAAAAAAPTLDGATYAVRLRDLEARVDELKEQIRRSHTRLSLLSDTLLAGGVGSSRASIAFQNDMSGAFRLTRLLFVLDGAVQYNKQDDTGALSSQKQIPIFKGTIAPGDHTLQVLLRLRGHGYGVFSYLRGYQFEVKQSHSFTVAEGKQVDLDVIAWEKGGVTTPLEQRPAVRYLERSSDVPTPLGGAEDMPAPRRAGGGG